MNNRHRFLLPMIASSVILLLLSSCSSAPKRPPEVFTNRNASMGQLDLANQSVAQGDYQSAHIFLDEAWRLAVSTDDPESRVKVQLARGNAWFNQGQRDQAHEIWMQALNDAQFVQDSQLMSLCRLYLARGTLPEGSAEDISPEERQIRAHAAKSVARAELPVLKNNQLHLAFVWKVIGLADKELGNWKESEAALREAANIHEKNRYLEDAAYDWYLIASVRSRAGLFTGALQALHRALLFDRRAENTNGLGMNWMAVGQVYERMGETKKARAAYTRASEIFDSGFLKANAEEARQLKNRLPVD